ncbi:MAG: glycosyltransferase family 4 protein [Verrucomicrobiae bacterium]|nr:glycosyltransferase family 4 protein [Verrucomicrobiae bacterium]
MRTERAEQPAQASLPNMRIVQITPGAGAMYCGNCFRDNALVGALRRLGHDVTMLPLYLPLRLDEDDQSADAPVFFSGINVYLDQKSAWFRRAPRWLHRLLASRRLLARLGARAAKTRPADTGDMLLSMLRGEEGAQARELDELIEWLQGHGPPDVVCLSNALLLGLARRLKTDLGAGVACALQGEDTFLDALPEAYREPAWRLIAERAADVDVFIAPSRYFGDSMAARLGLPAGRVRVVYNGINLDGFERRKPRPPVETHRAPVLGFFARMCPDKGLDVLVDAYIELKRRGRVPRLKLHVGGSCGPGDEPFVREMRRRLAQAGFVGEVNFSPNVSRAEKIEFLRALTVFSVPARYAEAFGLYVIEALAAGVPVVQPRRGAFPELVEATGGGLLCEPDDPTALADAIESLLLNPERAAALGQTGQQAVFEKFSAEAMARETVRVLEEVLNLETAGAARQHG